MKDNKIERLEILEQAQAMRKAGLIPKLSVRELMVLYGWSRGKIYLMMKDNRIPFIRFGKQLLFNLDEVENSLFRKGA